MKDLGIHILITKLLLQFRTMNKQKPVYAYANDPWLEKLG